MAAARTHELSGTNYILTVYRDGIAIITTTCYSIESAERLAEKMVALGNQCSIVSKAWSITVCDECGQEVDE